MGEFGRCRLLEARDPHALRVDPAEHVLDRPVLSACVQCLKHDEDRVPVLSVEQVLHVGELRAAVFRRLLGHGVGLMLAGERGIDLAEA
jgi:hypothetical protein